MTTTVLTLTDLKNLQTGSDSYKVKVQQAQEHEQKLAARRDLMRQLVTYITSTSNDLLREAAAAGRGDTVVFRFRNVMRDPEDPSGQRKLFPPEECYWTGLDDDGQRLSSSTGGVPFSVLAFGPRVKGQNDRMYNDRSKLPDGKTLGMLLEEHYKGCKVVTRFNRTRMEGTVRLVWDVETWEAREKRQRESRAQERGSRRNRTPRPPVDK